MLSGRTLQHGGMKYTPNVRRSWCRLDKIGGRHRQCGLQAPSRRCRRADWLRCLQGPSSANP